MSAITPENAQFALLSFEGPDAYSAAGGLAVRVRELAQALATAGFTVHLFFVGDPNLPPDEVAAGVHLHRCAQRVSGLVRGGVYDAQELKIDDLCASLPSRLADLVYEGNRADRATIVLGEEWQMVEPLSALHDVLVELGARHRALLAWNANNKFGFERIDWPRLRHIAEILTISWYMKHLLWLEGVNPLVVPNGIPPRWLDVQAPGPLARVRRAFARDYLVAKVGRWHPDKRWIMAIDALARLREVGRSATLIVRGWQGDPGAASHLAELRERATAHGLRWEPLVIDGGGRRGLVESLERAGADPPEILEVASFLPDDQLSLIYGAADAVLANSGFEPFGLVGLEVMASRGIAVTGSSGEDYVISFRNGFALDTDDPDEIILFLDWLRDHPVEAAAIRKAARETAKLYTWDHVVDRLLLALQFAARPQGVGL